MKQREIVFYSEGSKMAGTIYLPDDYKEGEKRPGIIANSGWTGLNVVYPAMFARYLTDKGYVCMGFDYRGFKPSGGVGGMDKYTTMETEVEDVSNALAFFEVQPEVDAERIGLVGWGIGGAVCVEVTARENVIRQRVKAVATLNGFVDGVRWMRMGLGNDKYNKLVKMLEEDRVTRVTTGDPVLRHPYATYPNIDESGDFYVDNTLKNLNGGLDEIACELNDGEAFPTPMATVIGESYLRTNITERLKQIAPAAVFVGHGKYNELHDKMEAEDAYKLANGPKALHLVEGKHNEWMFDNDPKLVGLLDAMTEFFGQHI